ENKEVAVEVAGEEHIPGGRRDPGVHRLRRMHTPDELPGLRIDGVDPARRLFHWIGSAEPVDEPRIGDHRGPGRDRPQLEQHAPVDRVHIEKIVGEAVRRAVPLDYRLSPFELESALIEHAAVAEAAVVPAPDPVRFTTPKAYIVLAPGF